MSKKKKYEHRIPVRFAGSVTHNKVSARIGFTTSREDFTLDQAEELFCMAQLDARLECDPNAKGDAKGQNTFSGKAAFCVDVAGEVRSFKTKGTEYVASIVFPKTATDAGTVVEFPGMTGHLHCTRIGAVEDGQEESDDD